MPTDVLPAADTINEFCERYRISRALYYKLKREGRGPRELRIGRRRLISREAADAWRKELETVDADTQA